MDVEYISQKEPPDLFKTSALNTILLHWNIFFLKFSSFEETCKHYALNDQKAADRKPITSTWQLKCQLDL